MYSTHYWDSCLGSWWTWMIPKGRKEYYRSLKLRRKNKERSFYFVLMRLLVLSKVIKKVWKRVVSGSSGGLDWFGQLNIQWCGWLWKDIFNGAKLKQFVVSVGLRAASDLVNRSTPTFWKLSISLREKCGENLMTAHAMSMKSVRTHQHSLPLCLTTGH